ncbi:hypothetical protein HYALB_00010899 [Hymenoscyphus albidus]|uniref:Uncharacterized protein n=1 Tax=Hymenoscyphus albidus TaxID=595503 RepID=A0A9N9Q6T6_9HELO|nr:hypothetical protein HYALB_00010899 [Hymenoscyphus albidus]
MEKTDLLAYFKKEFLPTRDMKHLKKYFEESRLMTVLTTLLSGVLVLKCLEIVLDVDGDITEWNMRDIHPPDYRVCMEREQLPSDEIIQSRPNGFRFSLGKLKIVQAFEVKILHFGGLRTPGKISGKVIEELKEELAARVSNRPIPLSKMEITRQLVEARGRSLHCQKYQFQTINDKNVTPRLEGILVEMLELQKAHQNRMDGLSGQLWDDFEEIARIEYAKTAGEDAQRGLDEASHLFAILTKLLSGVTFLKHLEIILDVDEKGLDWGYPLEEDKDTSKRLPSDGIIQSDENGFLYYFGMLDNIENFDIKVVSKGDNLCPSNTEYRTLEGKSKRVIEELKKELAIRFSKQPVPLSTTEIVRQIARVQGNALSTTRLQLRTIPDRKNLPSESEETLLQMLELQREHQKKMNEMQRRIHAQIKEGVDNRTRCSELMLTCSVRSWYGIRIDAVIDRAVNIS